MDLDQQISENIIIIQKIKQEIHKKIIWQEKIIEKILICILSSWHILIEWVPGIAKTLIAKTFAWVLDLDFKRVSFTPDLLPSDLIWTEIFNMNISKFTIKKWPIFCNILLADEINRAPSKVQSALLEVMWESQITIWDESFLLDKPFIVLATQNPIEQSWTYNLPEAELDRFMMKIYMKYPNKDEEKQILENILNLENTKISKIISKKDLINIQQTIKDIHISQNLYDYILDIISATRQENIYIQYWVSPRGSIDLIKASKAVAFLRQRSFIIPEDIKYIATEILSHRLVLSYEAQAENINWVQIILQILERIKIK